MTEVVYIISGFLAGAGLVWFFSFKRKSRKDLDQAQNLYRKIALEGGDISFSLDFQTNRIQWSKDLPANMLGYDVDEMDLQPETFSRILHAEDKENFLRRLDQLSGKSRLNQDVRLINKQGKPIWVQIIMVTDKRPEQEKAKQAIGIVRNTEQQHQTLARAAKTRHNEALGTIAGGMAHEFNNHLTPVRGYIELALDYLGKDHPVSDGLQTAQDQVDYCTGLIEQIQAYGRISILMKEHVDLTGILPSALRIALSTNRESAAKIKVNQVHPASLQTVMVDKTQIRQAVVQLVQNSMEAMPDGGTLTVETVPVSLTDELVAGREDLEQLSENLVCLKIIDTGIGIQPELLERIFDPFFSTQGKEGARGMGLPMVQGMVAQHNGWMEIDSKPGEGTEVRIFLPMSQPYSQGGHPEDNETMTVLPAASVGHILIADDEDHIRKLIRKVFKQEGWATDEASDYEQVLNCVEEKSNKYDLIILDLSMTGPAPEESISRIVKAYPKTKILVISGDTNDERIGRLVEGNQTEFLSKPFSPSSLLTCVDSMLAEG